MRFTIDGHDTETAFSIDWMACIDRAPTGSFCLLFFTPEDRVFMQFSLQIPGIGPCTPDNKLLLDSRSWADAEAEVNRILNRFQVSAMLGDEIPHRSSRGREGLRQYRLCLAQR